MGGAPGWGGIERGEHLPGRVRETLSGRERLGGGKPCTCGERRWRGGVELGRGDPTWTRRLAVGPVDPAVVSTEPGRAHSFLLAAGFLLGLR